MPEHVTLLLLVYWGLLAKGVLLDDGCGSPTECLAARNGQRVALCYVLLLVMYARVCMLVRPGACTDGRRRGLETPAGQCAAAA